MKSRRLTCITVITLFAAVATAAHAQISVLYNFGSNSGDPLHPQYSGIIAQGRDGNLYSTAPKGGANGYGAVFKFTPKGTLSVLYSFDGTHGSSPNSGLTLGTDGNFYGTTTDGGSSGYGTVFKITPSGTLTTLYNFTGGADGEAPTAPPIQGTDGNFYGTASQGNGSTTFGSVYKLTPSGAFTVLHTFDGGNNGACPYAPLLQGNDGNFYGTTSGGGGCFGYPGTAFKITPWGKYAIVSYFTVPVAPLIQGSDGSFYGTTVGGGNRNLGEVFRIIPGVAPIVLIASPPMAEDRLRTGHIHMAAWCRPRMGICTARLHYGPTLVAVALYSLSSTREGRLTAPFSYSKQPADRR